MVRFMRAAGLALAAFFSPVLAFSADEVPVPVSLQYEIELVTPRAQRTMLEAHLDLYRWQTNEYVDEGQLRRLVRLAPAQIREFLSLQGYYSPRIESTLTAQGDRWLVKLAVEPGEPVHVRSVEIAITGPLNDGTAASRARLETIRGHWKLPPGGVFRHADWESAKRAALKELLLEHYPSASITSSRAAVDVATGGAALQLTLDSGPAFTMGGLKLTGLKRYPATVVSRLNPIKPGDPYNQAKLLDLQSRLQGSPYFSGAAVSVETDPLRNTNVPVQVDVTENPSRKVGFGIGASTDTGPRGQIDYRDLNVFDEAWRLSSSLKVAGKQQSVEEELQFPLTQTGERNSVNALLERTDIEGEIANKLVLGFRRGRQTGALESIYGVRYFQETRDLSGGQSTRSSALVPSKSWTWRKVDSLVYPTQGYVFAFQIDGATKAIVSDRDFLRTYVRGSSYHPVGERGQLIARAEAGVVVAQGRDGIPSDLLFRTGGDQTVRGYAYQSLGVKEGAAIVGGRLLGVASLEYVHWLHPRWGAAAFFDAGNAADSAGDFQLAQGYGLGARWKSPVGPLNLDLAYGERTRAVRLHFSVGLAF